MRVLVGGVHLGGDGYPNARNTIRLMQQRLGIQVIECGRWLPANSNLWAVAQAAPLRKLATLASLVVGNLQSLVRILFATRRGDWVYVPHPGLFFLWLASWLPRRARPRCVLDGYISVWDSLHADRDRRPSRMQQMLRRFEARAWRAAQHVIVDTTRNREHFVRTFALDPARVHAWPLAIDEPPSPAYRRSGNDSIRVLYLGTLVPLHGVEHLAALAQSIDDMPGVELDIVGTGQQAQILEQALAGCGPRVRWTRDWQGPRQVERWIAGADICLGVFGGAGKASRVLPFKLYHYFAQGRAVISQRELSLPEGVPAPPIHAIDPTCHGALAGAVRLLAEDRLRRETLAAHAAEYYGKHLSHDLIVAHWSRLMGISEEPAFDA